MGTITTMICCTIMVSALGVERIRAHRLNSFTK